MNYYERHLGDYARDTAHLSMLEHGAYTLLMDRYYTTEAGIPADQVHRLMRARSKEEKAAVDVVLAEFFSLSDGVWVKGRIEEEIEKYLSKKPQAEEKKINNAERQRRARERRKELFAELASHGITLPWNTTTEDAQAELSRITSHDSNAPVTRDNTANQTPVTKPQTPNYQTHSNEALTSVEPTLAGTVCLELKKLGYLDINPSHPKLLSMLKAGATLDEFVNAAKTLSPLKKKFVYLMGTVEGMRKQAAQDNVTVGNFEEANKAKAWRNNAELMVAKARELGIGTSGIGKFDLIAKIDAKIEQMRKQA